MGKGAPDRSLVGAAPAEKAAHEKITLRDMLDIVRDPLVSGDQNGYGQVATCDAIPATQTSTYSGLPPRGQSSRRSSRTGSARTACFRSTGSTAT